MASKRGLSGQFKGIITGASSGIGKAMALELAAKYQARLVLNARSEEQLEATCKAVEEAGGKAVKVVGDVGDKSVIEATVNTCLETFGSVDVLVNNAGLATPGTIMKLTVEDWERVFAVNFFAPLRLTYAVLPHFTKSGRGKIVNISSVAGKIAFPGSVCYAASKFALTGMSEGMAAELASQNIDIITVCPGWVRTEFFEKNRVAEAKNPTSIASRNNIQGFIMRSLLSISSEECSAEIVKALEKGGSSEIILTHPGKIFERLAGICPPAVFAMAKRIPSEISDSSKKTEKN
jgi:short-subunit dehydrogenase